MTPFSWTTRAAALLLGALLAAGSVHAADRALLIGVGKYRVESANLPGIDLDIGIMQEVAESLGFPSEGIRTITDEAATLDGVRSAIRDWLVQGTQPGDRVLLYYSGHGTQLPDDNGDEDDGLDEALTMHDLGRVQRDGRVTLGGVLLDDELAQLLAAIPSRNVLVLVDACHSGTATRSSPLGSQRLGVSEGMPKVFRDPQVATRALLVQPVAKEAAGGNHIAITAAADREQSIATARGSVFTLGLHEALVARKSAGRVTARELWRATTDFVAAKLDAPRRFHPQLGGNLALADRPVLLAATAAGQGAARRKIEQMVAGASGVQVQLNQAQFREGATMQLSVAIDRPGYLNVVTIGPDDVPIVLFPNQHHPDNRVAAGTLQLPSPQMRFSFVASPPYGATLVAAFVTDEPVDLYRAADGERDAQGKMVDVLGRLSESSVRQLRAFRVEAARAPTPAAAYRAGSATASICPATGACP